MPLLTKEQILAALDFKSEELQVPEWGGTVRVRGFSGADRDAYEQWLMDQRGDGSKAVVLPNLRARLVALSVVGENGVLLFSDADIDALGKKSAKALDRVYAVAARVNGMGDAEIKAIEKN